jgi:hypothetical protein
MNSSAPSVGTQVEAQTVAGAMAGERPYREIRFPATGDEETELVNLVHAFVGNRDANPFFYERMASVFDYLAKRFRDIGRETGRQQANLAQPLHPEGWMREIDRLSKEQDEIKARYMASARDTFRAQTPPPARTALEALAAEDMMRAEMMDKMRSHVEGKTLHGS